MAQITNFKRQDGSSKMKNSANLTDGDTFISFNSELSKKGGCEIL